MVSEARINESIARLLKEKFQLGLFENPYVDPVAAAQIVGAAEFQKRGDLALRKSIVLLRNKVQLLPLKAKTKVYFESYYDNGKTKNPATVVKPSVNNTGLEFVDNKEQADVVLLWLTPNSGTLFSSKGAPIELSLSKNKIDVSHVNEITHAKPTVVVINFTNPWVIDEIDNGDLKSVVATFGVTKEALLDVVSGAFNPTGKMPFTTPSSRQAVMDNQSDVPGFMKPKGYGLFMFGDGLSY